MGAACWVAGVLVIALLASRRSPLPRGWEALHRVARPAVSALVAVVLVAVAAGFAAAAYAAVGDAHPRRIAGAALLGAPNGVWLAIPLGLFVPWNGRATGTLTTLLPDPLDKLLGVGDDQAVTLGRLAQLDGRIWVLAVATSVLMLYAGVLAAARTPVYGRSPGAFTGRCALALAGATALALPLMVWLTGVSANASLSVLGFDAFGAADELHGNAGLALALGAAWGAAAGAAGALLARVAGAAGRRAAHLASEAAGCTGAGRGDGGGAGPVQPGAALPPAEPRHQPVSEAAAGAARLPHAARPPRPPADRAPAAQAPVRGPATPAGNATGPPLTGRPRSAEAGPYKAPGMSAGRDRM